MKTFLMSVLLKLEESLQMQLQIRIRHIVIGGFTLLLLMLLIVAGGQENGDLNAGSMYFVVFMIPCLILSALNGLYIFAIARMKNKVWRSILAVVPVILLFFLSGSRYLKVTYIDGDLAGLALLAGISFAITNAVWIMSFFQQPRR